MADETPKAALEALVSKCGVEEAVTERIRERAERIVTLYTQSVEEAWEVGKELVQVKKRIKYGYWVPWVETQIGLPRRTAQRLMELYTRDPKKRHVSRFESASEALRLLPPAKSKTGAAKQQAAGKSGAKQSDLAKMVARLESILKKMPASASTQRKADLEVLVKLTVAGATTLIEHLRAPADGDETVVGPSEQARAKLKEALEMITEHR